HAVAQHERPRHACEHLGRGGGEIRAAQGQRDQTKLEFLASDKGQEMYADVNNEYPVKDGIPWSKLVQSWGDFKPDPISLNEIAGLRKKASELVDKVGFDDGPSS